MNDLIFLPESHTYLIRGVEAPSVSSVLDMEYKGFPLTVKDYERGTRVHKACFYVLRNPGLLKKVFEDIRPYAFQFLKFLKEWELTGDQGKVLSEVPLFHQYLDYGFTPDIFFIKPGFLIDIKTGAKGGDRYESQIIAYEEGLKSYGLQVNRRLLLYLSKTSYRPVLVSYDKLKFIRFKKNLKEIKKQ